MAIQTFEDLEVWKRSSQLAVDAFISVHDLKDFTLKDQISRCSLSIPSNIAEGYERDSDQDTIRFLRIAKGSCAELRTQLYIAQKIHTSLGLPLLNQTTSMIKETREISVMLQGLIKAIQKRTQS
ncbi:four helix bundle protein [Akkermansiaceae bacterium]|nr:four helix bundle protein [Akkermansiaceae bacterium]MDA7888406.1 four helix bundle protein [Akkermansiaceae bacterium]